MAKVTGGNNSQKANLLALTEVATLAPTKPVVLAKVPDVQTDIFGTILTITLSNGDSYELDTAKQSADINQAAMLHGYKQKMVDAAAISRNPETGATATIEDKSAAIRDVFNRLTGDSPTWNKVREGEKKDTTSGTLLLRALMQMSGKSKEAIQAYLEPMDKATRKALAANPQVAATIATMQAAAVDKSIDTSSMLASLGVVAA